LSALPVPPLHEPPWLLPPTRRRAAWKRALRWIAGGVGLIAILAAVALFALLHNARFHRFVLHTAEQKASAALGTRVEARDYALRWSGISPAVDLYDVVVYGAAPYATPPLFEADRIRLELRVVSILRRAWYLNEVRVDHPVARLTVDAQGRSNLPELPSRGQSHSDVFALAIRHVLLDHGNVYYNDRKSALEADLHALTFQSVFDTSQESYSGKLSYRDGQLQFGVYNPVPHDFEAQFEASRQLLRLDRATLTSGRSQLALQATLQNYNQPRIEARYTAVLNIGDVRRILKKPSLPAGAVESAGSLQYQSDPSRRFLETVTLNGSLNSRALEVDTRSLRTRISSITGRYEMSGGNLAVNDLRARLLGGELTGSMTMRNVSGATQSHLHAQLRDVSLANLETLANSQSIQQVSLRGIVSANADAAWGKTLDDLVAHTDAMIQGRAAPGKGGASLPVNGGIHARYAAARREITFANSHVETPQTSLTLNGTVSRHSSLTLQIHTADLHEVETFADALGSSQTTNLGLHGTASFVGSIRGSTSSPQITGQLNAGNLQVRGTSWRLARANVSLSPSQVSLRNGDLEAAARGRIAFDASAGLNRWSFSETSPLHATLNASQIDVGDLAKLAGSQIPVSGVLSATVALHGSELNPSGQGTLTLAQARVADEPIQSASLNFQASGAQVTGKLALRAPAGPAQAQFTYIPGQHAYQVQLDATGLHLDRLQTFKARRINLAGVLDLQARGQGTFENPQLTASVTASQLKVRGQSISGLKLQADVANHVGSVSLDSEVANTSVHARGTVDLNSGYYAQATLDTQAIPLQTILAAYAPSEAANITGQTELHATLRGPLKNRAQIEAHATIPNFQANYKDTVQIAAAGPIHLDYTNGVLALERATLRGTDTDLTLQGAVPTTSGAPISLLLLGTVDLRLAQLFDPDVTSSGQLRFNVSSFGSRVNPNVQGQVQILNANLTDPDLPVGLQNGNGVLTLTRDRLEVTEFRGTMGGGTVTASGAVLYRPSLGFNLAATAKNMRMLYPDGMRESVNAHLTLTGTPEAARLGGQVRIDDLSFTPDFDLNTFLDQFGGATLPTPTTGFSQNLELDVGLESSSNISLSSRTLSLNGTANLRVSGSAAQPVILGRVNLSAGDLIFNGHRYTIESGTLEFANPVETEANVNLTATTTIQQYNIRVQFQGPIDHLHTAYSSDPSLPPSDIINLLAFGKTTEASAANPAPGNLGAEAAVASQVSSQITSRAEKIAGISQLSIDPLLDCNQQTSGGCVTVQQRVSGQIFVTFQTDVNDIQQETVEVQYQATPRVTISGTRDQNGGFGFDARIRKTW
jgi:translocation and assembly module TamB